MSGICGVICMCDTCNNSLIQVALSVVRLLLELLEAFEVLLVALLLTSCLSWWSHPDVMLILVLSC